MATSKDERKFQIMVKFQSLINKNAWAVHIHVV